MTRRIPLTRGQYALVNYRDYRRLMKHTWYARWDPGIRGFRAVRSEHGENGEQHTVYMHREILNAQPGRQVDHVNHDPLDNRRCNLRLCSGSNNQHNQRPRTVGTSRHKGVSWYKRTQKWQAQICCNSRRVHLGSFDSEDDAAAAYNRAAVRLHGAFARLNDLSSHDNPEIISEKKSKRSA